MKKILIIFCIFIFNNFTHASEITGTISTKMESSQNNSSDKNFIATTTSVLVEKVKINNYIPESQQIIVNIIESKETSKIKVKGIEFYPDASLLRDELGRIYVIYGNTKKHIQNLEELKKYTGIAIFDVLTESLEQYSERSFVDGDLIRQMGHSEIFVVISDKKRHIKSLEELKAKFFKKEIFNISEKEMNLY